MKNCAFIKSKKITTTDLFIEINSVMKFKKKRVYVSDFYVSKFEVTVDEYLTFYREMINKFGIDSAYNTYYPDTLCFHKTYPLSYSEPLAHVYFWHPKFKNYPIVGISWEQANAYCLWLEQKLINESKTKYNKNIISSVRMPTEAEWIAATIAPDADYKGINSNEEELAIKAKLIKSHFSYYNTGGITTEYGFDLKGYDDDGFMLTAPVKSKEINENGIYNLLGNVSEFVSDTVEIEHAIINIKDILEVTLKKDFQKQINSIEKHLLDSFLNLEKEGDTYALFFYNYRNINPKKSLIIITNDGLNDNNGFDRSLIHVKFKGASWKDDVKFLNPLETRILLRNQKTSSVGFRIVVSFKEN